MAVSKQSCGKGRVRVGTLNVHGPIFDDRLASFVRLIHSTQLDLVFFQETDGRSLRRVAEGLKEISGLQWKAEFGGHSNGMLTHHEIVDCQRLELRAASASRELRGAMRCVLELCFTGVATAAGHKTAAFVGTHLDWKREETRLEQMRFVLDSSWESDTLCQTGYLLCGDLNALTRDDYHQGDWERIASDREKARFHLQGPRCELLDLLKEKGFSDSGRKFRGNGKSLVWTTSRFRTRIDYILASPGFDGRFSHYQVIDTQSSKLTDHNLVCVDVTWPDMDG